MTQEAYPLSWPTGWPRTDPFYREWGQFSVTFAKARDQALVEIDRLGGTLPIISSNLSLRRDGIPYANEREPQDPGIAVYFEKDGKQMVFACDRYDKTWKNLRAIGKTIEAIRGIERWGASDMMERALSAFIALPAPRGWREDLGFDKDQNPNESRVRLRYVSLAKTHHPDTGGDVEQFKIIKLAYESAQDEFHQGAG